MALYFIYTVLLLLIYFAIGWGAIKLFRIKLPVTSFVPFFAWLSALGFILSSILIALIFSYGKTIALAAILPLLWFFYSLKKWETTNLEWEKINLKEILGLIFVIAFFYFLNYYSALYSNYNHGDTIFRAHVSNLMLFLNKETISSNDLLMGFNSSYSSYHYMYLWNNGIVSYLFTQKNPLISYLYITNPTLLLISVLLFYSILRIFIKKIYLALFLSLAVWFFPFINFTGEFMHNILSILNINIAKFDDVFINFGFSLNYPILFHLYQIKTIHFLLILLFGIYTYSFNTKSTISIFGLAPVFSPLLLTLPASYFFIQAFGYKNQKKTHLLLLPIFILIYFSIIFFILNNPNIKSPLSSFFLYPYMCELKIITLIHYVLIILLTLFVFGFIQWISILLYGLFIPKNQISPYINWLILLSVAIFSFVILAVIFTYGNINSSQYINMNFIFLPFILFIVLSYFISIFIKTYLKSKKYLLLIIGIIFILISFNAVHYLNKHEYFNAQHKVEGYFDKQQCFNIFQNQNNEQDIPIKIGVINGFSYIYNVGIFQSVLMLMPSLYIKESYFSTYPYGYRIVSVLLDTLPLNTQFSDDNCMNEYYYKNLKNYLPFDIYWQKNFSQNPVPLNTARLRFIKEQELRYILLTNRPTFPQKALPQYLRILVDTFYIPAKMHQDTLFVLKRKFIKSFSQ
jgi:hypothetical protein